MSGARCGSGRARGPHRPRPIRGAGALSDPRATVIDMDKQRVTRVELAAWGEGDFWLLERANAPEMTDHLGGPESTEALERRHRRYLEMAKGGMFRVVAVDGGEGVAGRTVGSIGFWEREWRGGQVWETGWAVLPEFQGRGVAAAAAGAVVEAAREAGGHRHLHAFPSVDHPASNGVCKRAGFVWLEEVAFEYPKGTWMTCNDWRLDLWEATETPEAPEAPDAATAPDAAE